MRDQKNTFENFFLYYIYFVFSFVTFWLSAKRLINDSVPDFSNQISDRNV